MKKLSDILHRLAGRHASARSWAGPRPEQCPSAIAAIAAKVGLEAQGRESDFIALSKIDAHLWLTLFASSSLLHPGVGQALPDADRRELESAFNALGDDAEFFSKGHWEFTRRGKKYDRVTAAGEWTRSRYSLYYRDGSIPLAPIDVIVDGGIIGFDNEKAFIFWVDEDD